MRIIAETTGTHADTDTEVSFANNFPSFLFSDCRYELNSVEISRTKNLGRATTMKNLVASRSQLNGYSEYCKTMKISTPRSANLAETIVYDVTIPLSAWFGFCDDYRKILVNSRHELILTMSKESLDSCTGGGAGNGAATVSLKLDKVVWKMPTITLSDRVKLNMLNYLEKNRKIGIQYRSMEMLEYPKIPDGTTNFIWQVKTVPYLSRPRFVILGLQVARKNVRVKDASKFDSCNVSEARLHLNSQIFPYNMNEINVEEGLCSELFSTYAAIQSSYYNGMEQVNPFGLGYQDFQDSPLFVFDTSRTDESLLSSVVDIKVELKAREAFPANTACYALIIYDSEFIYSPFDSVVVRNV